MRPSPVNPTEQVGALVGFGLRDAVQHHRHHEQSQPGRGREGGVDIDDRPEHQQPQATGTHDGGDADHGYRQQKGLVETGHYGGAGQGNLHIQQHSPLRGAIGAAGFHHIGRDLTDAQVGEPYQGGDGKHHGDHGGRLRPQSEEKDEWNDVHEGVNNLHGVQGRPHCVPHPVHAATQHPKRYADDGADHH